jgi:hypothetical protein
VFAKTPKSYAAPSISRILLGINKAAMDEVSDELENCWDRFIKKSEMKTVTETVKKNVEKKSFK